MICSCCNQPAIALRPDGTCLKCRPVVVHANKGPHVIRHNGLYRRKMGVRPDWVPFSLAKIYNSRKLAEYAVKKLGYGEVLERMETEEETIGNKKGKK